MYVLFGMNKHGKVFELLYEMHKYVKFCWFFSILFIHDNKDKLNIQYEGIK